MGDAHERNFPQGCERCDRSCETYLCGLFWFVAQQKIEIDALSRKNIKMFFSKVFFLCWAFAIISRTVTSFWLALYCVYTWKIKMADRSDLMIKLDNHSRAMTRIENCQKVRCTIRVFVLLLEPVTFLLLFPSSRLFYVGVARTR